MKYHDFDAGFGMPMDVADLGIQPGKYRRLALRYHLFPFWAALVGFEAGTTLDYETFGSMTIPGFDFLGGHGIGPSVLSDSVVP